MKLALSKSTPSAMASLPQAPQDFPAMVVVEVKVQRSEGVHTYTVTEVAFLNHPRGLIRKGDVILEVNGVPLTHVTPSQLGVAVRASTTLTMDIHREESDPSPRSPRPRSPRRPAAGPESDGSIPILGADGAMQCRGWETECLPLQLSLVEEGGSAEEEVRGETPREGEQAKPTNGWCVAPGPNTPGPIAAGHATVEAVGGVDEADWESVLEDGLEARGEARLAMIFRRPHFMVMKMRGPEEACHTCGRWDCSTEHLQAHRSALTFASDRSGSLSNLVLRLLQEESRVRVLDERDSAVSIAPDGSVMVAPCRNPVPDSFCMTIFRFKSTVPVDAGEPVVMGFYNSNCYLACQENSPARIALIVETHSRDEFRNISSGSELFRLVFYRKESPDGMMRFESACFPSWFVYSGERHTVQMHHTLKTPYTLVA